MELFLTLVALCLACGFAVNPQTIYIRKDGSDDYGEGTFELPFLTIQHANDMITDASSTLNYVFKIGSGIYEDDFDFRPWIHYQGEGVVTISSDVTIGFYADSWTDAFTIAWVEDFAFLGAISLTFPDTTNVTLFFYPCHFNDGATFVGNYAPNSHQLILDNVGVFGVLTVQDIQYALTVGGTSVRSFPVVAKSTLALVTTLIAYSGAFDSGLNLTTTTGGGVVGEMRGCSVQGKIYLDGAATTYSTTVEGIPANVIRLNNAPAPFYLSFANALGFTPATGGNWLSAVPTAQAAFDYIAGKLPSAPMALWVAQEQQTSGTNGQDSGGGTTFSSGAWRIRALNSLASVAGAPAAATGNIALSSHTLTVQPGTYVVEGSAPARAVDGHVARLFDITGSVAAIIGTAAYAENSLTANVASISLIYGTIVVSGSARTYRLEHQCETSRATDGFGRATGITTEVYSSLKITQIA